MLITSDLHLTANDADAYRFGVFKWLEKQLKKFEQDELLILGDITDFKDYHPAVLENRIVDELVQLTNLAHITILCGNHDYKKVQAPALAFLNEIDGIDFIYGEPVKLNRKLFLPHTRDPVSAWNPNSSMFDDIDYVFMHESVIGSKTSEMYNIESGISSKFFDFLPKHIVIIAGDIHLPQRVGRVEYVGAPYRIRFGDNYKPRILLLTDKIQKSLYFPCISKEVVEITDPNQLFDLDLESGDQVKVRLKISKSSYPEWEEKKRKIQEISSKLGIDLRATELRTVKRRKTIVKDMEDAGNKTDLEFFERYCTLEKIDKDTISSGKTLVLNIK